jgi:hypothetical protein
MQWPVEISKTAIGWRRVGIAGFEASVASAAARAWSNLAMSFA